MNVDPDGGTTSDLEELITRHLDAGLEAEDQRRLARLLADSPPARRTLARYLRLEAALIRLGVARQLAVSTEPAGQGSAVTLAASRARDAERSTPGGSNRRWMRPATLAVAGLLLTGLLLVPLFMPWAGGREPRGGGIDLVAEEWLRVRRGTPWQEPVEPGVAPVDDGFAATVTADGSDIDESKPGPAPPAWLVAAVAESEADRIIPDGG